MEAGLVQILEGALLAAGEPLSVQRMALLFEENERPSNEDIRAAIKSVEERCEDRGYELVQVASGYRFQVRQDLATWVGRLWQERPARYSRALMETLSLIAYRQPITRGEIEEIRGVAVSTNIIKTLLEREWVRVVAASPAPVWRNWARLSDKTKPIVRSVAPKSPRTPLWDGCCDSLKTGRALPLGQGKA